MFSESFTNGPYKIQNNGDQIKITLNVSLNWLNFINFSIFVFGDCYCNPLFICKLLEQSLWQYIPG
jgi:hypothetical protein